MEINDDVQGGILRHHGRNFAAIIFISAGRSLKYLLNALVDIFPPTSVAIQNNNRKIHKINLKGNEFHLNYALTERAYRYLGVASGKMPRDIAFRKNARISSLTSLNEKGAVKGWETAFQQGFDALVLIAGDIEEEVMKGMTIVKSLVEENSCGNVHVEMSRNIRNLDGYPIEAFGFRDGISNPPLPETLNNNELGLSRYPVNSVIAKDPLGSYGSYLVYRKIRQDIDMFDSFTQSLADKLDVTAEYARSLCIGRNKDGTPLLPSSDGLNDFNYINDLEGKVCPFHSHIRRANPRDKGIFSEHSITRRGMVFYNKDNICDNGLHFLCYQRNISNQFEFIQREWINAQFDDKAKDPITATSNINNRLYTWMRKDGKAIYSDFPIVTQVMGGEYFFVPSLSGISALIGGR